MAVKPRTLFEKIWSDHVVSLGDDAGSLGDHVAASHPGAPAILAIDLHLVHEVTSPQAFTGLRERGLQVRKPGQTVATADHSMPTLDPSLPILDELAAKQLRQIEENCREFGIPFYGKGSPTRGIVHVIGPELGLTQPGMTIVCGDSHTATHGAFGALAFGIGTSEIEMVLATQTLLQRKPKTFRVQIDGRLGPSVGAKDIILALIARIGIGGGTGHVIEYTGEAIRALSMEERMTVCNMSIEGGRSSRPHRPGRDHLRVPQGPRVRSAGMRPGTRPFHAGGRYLATKAPPTTGRSPSTAGRSSRWSPTARTREWACR